MASIVPFQRGGGGGGERGGGRGGEGGRGGWRLLLPLSGVSEIAHRRVCDASVHVFTRIVRVCVRAISCQSPGDPPPLSSSDRIPPVLGFVF